MNDETWSPQGRKSIDQQISQMVDKAKRHKMSPSKPAVVKR